MGATWKQQMRPRARACARPYWLISILFMFSWKYNRFLFSAARYWARVTNAGKCAFITCFRWFMEFHLICIRRNRVPLIQMLESNCPNGWSIKNGWVLPLRLDSGMPNCAITTISVKIIMFEWDFFWEIESSGNWKTRPKWWINAYNGAPEQSFATLLACGESAWQRVWLFAPSRTTGRAFECAQIEPLCRAIGWLLSTLHCSCAGDWFQRDCSKYWLSPDQRTIDIMPSDL